MPSALTKYHRHFMPKGGAFFSKEMGQARKTRASQIKTLRNEVGRHRAKKMVLESAKKHVAGVNESNRKKKLSAFREKHGPEVNKFPATGGVRNVRHRRIARVVAHKKLPAVPRKLVKKPS